MFPETANWHTSADEWVDNALFLNFSIEMKNYPRIIHVGINAVIWQGFPLYEAVWYNTLGNNLHAFQLIQGNNTTLIAQL